MAKLSVDWPLARLVEIWNNIPGNTKVSKFAARKKAVARVWAAIQTLTGNDAAAAAESEPDAANKPKKASKPAKPPKPAKKSAKAKTNPVADRTNKKADVIAMMKRAKGATLAEIAAVTNWQNHTIRGFVSILGSTGGETIDSSKNAAGERVYKIAK